MNDIWYLDPVDAAKLYDKTIDLTSYDEVKRGSEAFLRTAIFDTVNGQISWEANRVVNGRIKRTTFVRPNIISSDGSRVLRELRGIPSLWIENDVQFIGISNFVVCVGRRSDKIAESIRINNRRTSVPEINPVTDDIEYI
jgi:hypothetical protein